MTIADRVYNGFPQGLQTTDLQTYLGALASMFQHMEDLSGDGANAEPGWSSIVDVNRCPSEGLPWLAQLVGARLPVGLTDAQQRAYINTKPGWGRGTPAAMLSALQATLTGGKTVIMRERDSAADATRPAYGLTIITNTAETPNQAASLAAILSQKPAGIILAYNVLAGQDFQSLFTNNATFQIAYTKYATMQGVYSGTAGQ